jgi:6-phosphogluconolactonase
LSESTVIVASDFLEAAVEQWRLAYREALSEGRSFSVALAGGGTPEPLYRRLGSEPLDWERIEVFLGDERAVAPDHPDSNWGMISRALLDLVTPPPENLHRPRGEADDLGAAAAEYGREMAQILPAPESGSPRFDLILLGMGDDGHTASLFPGSHALGVSDRWFVSGPGPSQAEARLTITYPVIQAARHVCVLVRGESKASTLLRVLEGDADLPASPLRTWPNVVWLTDPAAASEVLGAEPAIAVRRR